MKCDWRAHSKRLKAQASNMPFQGLRKPPAERVVLIYYVISCCFWESYFKSFVKRCRGRNFYSHRNGGEAVSVMPSLRGLQKWAAELKFFPCKILKIYQNCSKIQKNNITKKSLQFSIARTFKIKNKLNKTILRACKEMVIKIKKVLRRSGLSQERCSIIGTEALRASLAVSSKKFGYTPLLYGHKTKFIAQALRQAKIYN